MVLGDVNARARAYAALGDPSRLAIIDLLAQFEKRLPTQTVRSEEQVAAQHFQETHLFVVEGVRLDRIHVEGAEAGTRAIDQRQRTERSISPAGDGVPPRRAGRIVLRICGMKRCRLPRWM
mgnify:CR=1 FL=1